MYYSSHPVGLSSSNTHYLLEIEVFLRIYQSQYILRHKWGQRFKFKQSINHARCCTIHSFSRSSAQFECYFRAASRNSNPFPRSLAPWCFTWTSLLFICDDCLYITISLRAADDILRARRKISYIWTVSKPWPESSEATCQNLPRTRRY